MKTITHKFQTHRINPLTETLIIGTFNPSAIKNKADFFYGRGRNFLWRLLPTAFNESDLKDESLIEKLNFINKRKIDFIDLISEVEVDEETNYYDNYLDNKVKKWNKVISEIEKLKFIKRVCFTRETFSGIPQIKSKIEEVRKYCESNNILFQYLKTPSRFYREDKQKEWTKFITRSVNN